ncbi:NAD-dependent deacetylase [Weissella uvarum]|uniref:Sir2 family NAD-dependent protein deacetylase n=1 Tax=Weissella uvarum TaxID=1479233 RepID=UPI0019608DBC|nr:Sir2 family NAD-dependent protein deacetylase [Weissella uvarum]MBM7616926.1 NAD-dependent deacetylase [Weissella uvarum]MCM0594623.1 hypothetical protein [Weissella uvarum]
MTPTELTNLIQNEPTVFIVGAGLSTASGIRDFASLQQEFDTTTLLSTEGYYQHYWDQHDFMATYLMQQDAKPNLGHQWLAKLSQQPNIQLISQNIDDLLEAAHVNLDHLLKIHGSLNRFIDRNGTPVDMTPADYVRLDHQNHHNFVRPDIVFYGENVKEMDRALALMAQAKYLVVIGSRLNVAPVNQLATFANQLKQIIVINDEPVMPLLTQAVPVEQITTKINDWLAPAN